jgi:hypothetical protein
MVTGEGMKVNRKETTPHYDGQCQEKCWLISVIFQLSRIYDD